MEATNFWETSSILISLTTSSLELGEPPRPARNCIHGSVTCGSAMLTLQEAEHLQYQLQAAISQYKAMDAACKSGT